MKMPPGATTSTSNGSGGLGDHEKRPSLSVTVVPGRPRMLISAPATGSPAPFTTRPVNAKAGEVAKRETGGRRQTTRADCITTLQRRAAGATTTRVVVRRRASAAEADQELCRVVHRRQAPDATRVPAARAPPPAGRQRSRRLGRAGSSRRRTRDSRLSPPMKALIASGGVTGWPRARRATVVSARASVTPSPAARAPRSAASSAVEAQARSSCGPTHPQPAPARRARASGCRARPRARARGRQSPPAPRRCRRA